MSTERVLQSRQQRIRCEIAQGSPVQAHTPPSSPCRLVRHLRPVLWLGDQLILLGLLPGCCGGSTWRRRRAGGRRARPVHYRPGAAGT